MSGSAVFMSGSILIVTGLHGYTISDRPSDHVSYLEKCVIEYVILTMCELQMNVTLRPKLACERVAALSHRV